METSPTLTLDGIRKGKRKDYPDYFITIRQLEGYSAIISRERNQSTTIHFYDEGQLTFDTQMVDSFENIKLVNLEKLHLLFIPIQTKDYSGDFPLGLEKEIHDGKINFGDFLRVCLGLNTENGKPVQSHQWFPDLLNIGQNFIRFHLGTIRYFHGDFDSLKEHLLQKSSHDEEDDSFFNEPDAEDQKSFFDDDFEV